MSSPKMKDSQKSTPPLTNSIQMLSKSSDGDGENSTTKPSIALAKKIVASECFDLSRVRCAGWHRMKLFAQAQERIRQKGACTFRR